MVLTAVGTSPIAWAQGPATTETAATDAAWCWFSDPRAVYHQGTLYFGYINSRGDVLISARTTASGQTTTCVLHEQLQIDDHNVPSILILPDGHLLAFYTEHNGKFFLRKSKKPGDISAWDDERVLPFGNRVSYSHPVLLEKENNRIYLFWRGSDWRPSFSYSNDGGSTWADERPLIDSRGLSNAHRPYLKVTSNHQDRIDFIFTDGHPSREETNSVYHAYYQKGTFHQTNGERIGTWEELPLQHGNINKVYDATTTGQRAWIWDVALDAKNRPVVVYNRFPSETDHRYHYARWNGRKWVDEELAQAGGWMPITPASGQTREPHYSGGLVLNPADVRQVYLSRPVEGTFEIERWEKKKKKAWHRVALTSGSTKNNVRPYVVAHAPANQVHVLWMSGDYHHYTRFDTDLKIQSRNP
ncbi:hypothetical protein GCM10027275_22110 [Rhabdobacter roseus]